MSQRIIPKLSLIIAVLLATFASAQSSSAIPIATFSDLRKIGNDPAYPLDANYELVRDIDASDSRVRPFEPIGDFSRPFSGSFYGRGGAVFVVRNLYINSPQSGHVGLFGVIRYDGVVGNVGVVADSIIGHFAVGTLAGTNNGRISTCYGAGVVVAGREQSNAGGLVGANTGEISGSYSVASVDGRENVGGLVGLLAANSGGEVLRSFAGGSVRGANNVGGLVGHVFGGVIRESFSFSGVFGKGGSSVVGGLVGRDFAVDAPWNDRGITLRDSAYVRAAEVSGSYWDVGASGVSVSSGGVGKSSAEMMMRETFAGWDFDDIWSIVEGVQYPQLIDIPFYTYTFSYSVDSEERGQLRILDIGAGAVVVDLYSYERRVMSGAAVFLVEARPWEGFRFVKWSDGFADSVRSDTALADLSVVAIFERVGGDVQDRAFSYTAFDGGKIRVGGRDGLFVNSGDLSVSGGALGPAIAAVPDSGFRFGIWSDGVAGIVRSDAAVRDIAVRAFFDRDNREFILLSEADHLVFIGRSPLYPLDGNYELECDIDMSGRGFEPIGTSAAPFSGVFRGNGHAIHGLTIYRPGRDDTGFFGYLANAQISGVRLEANIVAGDRVGLLAGTAVNTVIDSCVTEGFVRGVANVGGLVGTARVSVISRSSSTAQVDGGEIGAGGLVGLAVGSFTALSRFAGRVNGALFCSGGLAGKYEGGALQHSYSTGIVMGRIVAGGLTGEVSGGAMLTECYAAGSVFGTGLSVGGLVGTLGDGGGRAAACFWDADVTGQRHSALGAGKAYTDMLLPDTYLGWDFENLWSIDAGAGYPWLSWFPPPEAPGMAPGKKQVRPTAASRPVVRIVGRTMYVNAAPKVMARVRLIDMRGRVVAGYDVTGAAKLSLRRIPAGKYVVEVRERGRRVSVSTVVLR